MIKLIIYDLDGTLIDSSKDIADSINWTLESLGFRKLPELLIREHVGSGVVHLIQSVLKESHGVTDFNKDGIFDRAMKAYRGRYSEHLLDATKLYPGVKTVLEFLKDRKQAVVTNKTEEFSRRILDGLGVGPYFFDVIGADRPKLPKKPAPDSLLKLMEVTKAKPDETVLIGDSMIDIQAARNAKIRSITVTYGFSTRAELEAHQPDLIINRLEDLLDCDLIK